MLIAAGALLKGGASVWGQSENQSCTTGVLINSRWFVLQLAVPHNDEWTRFARTLVEIRANRADSEEEGAVELSA
ncbi:hypothetical protein DUI87_18200 [Hirundo rustica rustica]|uniref:Uncharacterized protein n=1 Tax=Hirundo rustica rustica TaxID=333673 RepID=A0A3M0JW01_HIRRU|nr:hypothetical protein DUI87_18200 [Hirundo rustica rustica]